MLSLRPSLLRTGVLVITLIGLSACGFKPLYGGAGFSQLPGLEVSRGQERVDYLIEDALRDFLGDGRSPYHLTLTNETTQNSLGLSATGIARQYALVITTDYTLTDAAGAVITEGRLREESLFDASSDPYSLVSGASNAEEQASEAMAERLVQEIAVALRQREATANR